MLVRICPKCGSTDVHRSRRRGVTDHLRVLVFSRPYRCFQCNLRFYGSRFLKRIGGDSTDSAKKERSHRRRRHKDESDQSNG